MFSKYKWIRTVCKRMKLFVVLMMQATKRGLAVFYFQLLKQLKSAGQCYVRKNNYTFDAVLFLLLLFIFFGVYATYGIKIIKYDNNASSWYRNSFAGSALNVFRGGRFNYVPYAKDDTTVANFTSAWRDVNSPHRAVVAQDLPADQKPWIDILNVHGGITTYLGLWWRFTGVASWDYIIVALAFWGALTCALLYFLFRFFSVRLIAFAGTLVCGLWPQSIYWHMSSFRDSSRALFVIASLVLLCWLIATGFRWRKVLAIGICYGLLIGIGLGFRTDYFVIIPFFTAAAVLHEGITKFNIKKICLLLLVGSIFATFIYVIYANPYKSEHDSLSHVFYIGMNENTDDAKWKSQRDSYKWCPAYFDWYGLATAYAIANYRDNLSQRKFAYYGQWTHAIGGEILRMARHFPYDFLARGLMSTEESLTLKHTDLSQNKYTPFQSWLLPIYKDLHSFFSCRLTVVFICIFLLGFFSWKKSLWLLLTGVCLCSMYSLQHMLRHYFFLYFTSWLCLAFVFNLGFRVLMLISRHPIKIWKRIFTLKRLKNEIITVITVATGYLLVFGTFLYQEKHAYNEIVNLQKKEYNTLTYKVEPYHNSENNIIISSSDFNLELVKARNPNIKDLFKDGPSYYCEFISLELNFDEKDVGKFIPIFIAYDIPENSFETKFPSGRKYGMFNPQNNFNCSFKFPVAHAGTHHFTAPIYFCADNCFNGIIIPAEYKDCIVSLRHLCNPADVFYHGYTWAEPVQRYGGVSIHLPECNLFSPMWFHKKTFTPLSEDKK